MNKQEEKYWSTRYEKGTTGWDIGAPSTPIKTYIDSLDNKNLRILIPGAGNAYEAEYAWKNGFHNTFILDISEHPLKAFQDRNPDFPVNQLIHGDFFTHLGVYDLILEQTFFCSFIPLKENRMAYAKKISELLVEGGILSGLLFSFPLTEGSMEKRPFGGSKEEYKTYFNPLFKEVQIEDCYNSIPPRQGNEYFLKAKK